ncbi:uncharacterized protein PgNI_08288 [Pyricularia grisea]|uniref:Dihydrodipicolinate synthase-like protein n=1 Tax=Pyricularia grisea TaxID=148305 RepID=A0A6P8AVX3_PYRGI|nr:uncharacterized protein PgNI_08288 [Pyricularia grisea]TLD06376.1 hypothetical protein PgNI_08288 [Pyricularia grisea]
MAAAPAPGIYVPVPTFFASRTAADYTAHAPPVDVVAQVAHSLYLARAGIHGLVILGSTGEAVHMTNDERNAVLAGVRKGLDAEGFKGYPIIAGTAAQSVAEVVEQLKDAHEKAACQFGMVLVPGYFAGATSQEGIVRWFTAVADQSPIPVMIYHYPGVSNNVKVTIPTFATLSQHPNIVGCKLSYPDVPVHTELALHPDIDHSRFAVFTGLGSQLFPVVAVGGAGAIDGAAAFFPKAVVRLFELSQNVRPTDEEHAERRRLQYLVAALYSKLIPTGTIGIKEAVARLRGFGDPDGTRLPLFGGFADGDAEWARWKPIVDQLEEAEKKL